jgi:hypothetical protein
MDLDLDNEFEFNEKVERDILVIGALSLSDSCVKDAPQEFDEL